MSEGDAEPTGEQASDPAGGQASDPAGGQASDPAGGQASDPAGEDGAGAANEDGAGSASEASGDHSHGTAASVPAGEALGDGLLEAEMGPSSAVAHLYRGEVHRMTRWRERLDRTTNWAVTVMAAILTWAFTDPSNPHFIVLLGVVAVGIFLGIEAHRLRGYVVWRTRVRLIQENVLARGLDPAGDLLHENWREELADDYREPTVKISYEEALAHRLRGVYLALLAVLLVAWLVRTGVVAEGSLPATAAVGPLPGVAVLAAVGLLFVAALVVAFRPREWKGHPEMRSTDVGRWREG